MVAGNAGQRDPARERWFWIGVGFVSALAMLVVGLVFAVSLTARDATTPVARQPSPPNPTATTTAPFELPPPPVDPLRSPQARAVPPPPSPILRNTPPRPPAPRPPVPPRVRVTERPGGPLSGALPPPSAPGTISITVEKQAGTPGTASNGSAPEVRERVGGSLEERIDRSPPRRPGDARAARTARRAAPSVGAGGTTPPRLISGRDAEYPLDAMQDGATGTVVLKVVVDPEGYVERAVVTRSSGDARLDAAAVRAVMAWRYEPPRRGGTPVPGTDTATIEFFRRR